MLRATQGPTGFITKELLLKFFLSGESEEC